LVEEVGQMAKFSIHGGFAEFDHLSFLPLRRYLWIARWQQKYYCHIRLDILVVFIDYVYGAVRISYLVHNVPLSVFW